MPRFTAESLGIDIEAVGQDLASHRSLPIHTYYDPAVFEFELEAIFHASWQYLGPRDRVANVGDVMVGMLGRIPIAVAHAEDGQLYGFVNICRHRGFRVVESDKRKCRRLVCRYHHWAYRLDGSLGSAPDGDKEPNFDATEFSLLPVRVDTWGPGVFVNPNPDAPSLREAIPDLQARTDELGFKLEPGRWSLHREIVIDQESNWKLWYDNGTECYHCPSIHGKSFSDAFDVQDGHYEFILDGGMTSYCFKPSAAPAAAGNGGLRSQTYKSIQTFPGCQIVQQDDMMYMARMVPTGPERCRFIAHYFAEAGADPARVDRWIEIWHQTFEEDGEAATIQQTNMRSGRTQLFRYMSNREAPAQYINSLIWKAYQAYWAGPANGSAETP